MDRFVHFFTDNPWNIANAIWLGALVWWIVTMVQRSRGRFRDRDLPSGKFRTWKFYDKRKDDSRRD